MVEPNINWLMLLVLLQTARSDALTMENGVAGRIRRQVSLDDLIQGALSIVRPIIDTSQPLHDATTINKQVSSRQMPNRDREILGAPKYSSLDDVPICKGNSRICSFISCTAHNFKNDQSFANINLAAQVLADTKLRKAISKDPDALTTVCHEQGLSGSQCRLFQKGFQLIDKFISTIEPVEDSRKQTNQVVQEEDDFYTDELDAPPVPIRSASRFTENDSRPRSFSGSHTWSSHPEPVEAIHGHLLPQDPMALATFPPLLFTLPTMPAIPAFAPITPLLGKDPISPMISFNLDNQLEKQSSFSRSAKRVYPRQTRVARRVNEEEKTKDFDNLDEGWSRDKRHSDYYEDLENEPITERPKSSDKNDHAYYDIPVDDVQTKPPKKSSNGHINCLQYLQ